MDPAACVPLQYAVQNITKYVFEKLGERCAMPSIVLPTAIIYGLILLLGILGNLCTCLVILRNKCMQNPTNYYLFSLAISDLLVLVLGLPMELYNVFDVTYPYKFGEFVCKGRAFLIEFTSYASILTITCFSVERWLAICFPLRIKLFSTLDRAVKVIVAVWLCAFLAASPVLSIVVVNKLQVPVWARGQPWLPSVSDDNETLTSTDWCAMDYRRPLAQRNFIFSAFLLFFLLPAFLITLVYCHIVVRLCDRQSSLAGNESAKQKMRSRKSLLKILVSVVVMFFLCWLPFHMQRLLSIYLNEQDDGDETYSSAIYTLFSVVYYISGYCYYSNSACNPILYNILSAKYRMAFCKTILGERLTYKLLRDKCRSSTFGCPPVHSHLPSRLSTASLQRQALSPKMSNGPKCCGLHQGGCTSPSTSKQQQQHSRAMVAQVRDQRIKDSNGSAVVPLLMRAKLSVPSRGFKNNSQLHRYDALRKSHPPQRTQGSSDPRRRQLGEGAEEAAVVQQTAEGTTTCWEKCRQKRGEHECKGWRTTAEGKRPSPSAGGEGKSVDEEEQGEGNGQERHTTHGQGAAE